METIGLIMTIIGLLGSSMAIIFIFMALVITKWHSILKVSLIIFGATFCCFVIGVGCFSIGKSEDAVVQEAQYVADAEASEADQYDQNTSEEDMPLKEEGKGEEEEQQEVVKADTTVENVELNDTEENLRAAIGNVIAEDRLRDFMYIPDNNYTLITFRGSDSLTTNLIIEAAYIDIKDILENIQPIIDTDVRICVTFPVVDAYGNSKEQMMIKADYYLDTIKKINFENFLIDNVPYIADTWDDDVLFRKK